MIMIIRDVDFIGNRTNAISICTISINRFYKNSRVAAVSILTIFGQSKSLPVVS